MSNKLPRSIERAISIGLISAAALGGYALGERGNGHDSAANKPKVVATTPASPKPKLTPSHSATSTVLKKADMQVPLTPTGGDYNIAEKAAYDVTNGNSDVAGAEAFLAKITNPTVKTQAEHAVQVGIAELASYDVTNGNSDIKGAETLLDKITLPDVKAKADEAIDQGIAELAAYDVSIGNTDVVAAKALEAKISDPKLVSQVEKTISQEQSGNTDGADNTWNALYEQSGNGWDDLYNQSGTEWDTMYLHTDEYKQSYDQAK